ncbi:hypothetical protein [Burkholderia sp. 567]|uniref:hypothetical protein n=1 Tax=Burkholderia sp. 567 TaxID=3156413 RepID=UPI00339A0D4B
MTRARRRIDAIVERRDDRPDHAIIIVRLGDAGAAVPLDAAPLAHDASLLEVASWTRRCAMPRFVAPRREDAVQSAALVGSLAVRWCDLRPRPGDRSPRQTHSGTSEFVFLIDLL